MFELRIPSLGESVSEGVIVRWARREGEQVAADEVVLELETDKATTEIPSEKGGVLHILKQEGETVSVGDVVARIDEAGVQPARPTPAVAGEADVPEQVAETRPAPPLAAAAGAARGVGPLSPAVRNLLDEHGLEAGQIAATGKGGRLTKGDVLLHLEGRPQPAPSGGAPAAAALPAAGVPQTKRPPAVPAATAAEERVPLTRLRKRIAERLVAAQHTAAILTTFNEVDMSAVSALRAQHKDRFEKRHGVKLGFMSFFARACVVALAELPAVNAAIDGDDVVYHHHVHLGIAVGTERGLVVPVVRHAEVRSFADLEREIERLAVLARDGKLGVDDLQGGTFTISNGGVYGSLLSTPILNPPQSGILGMHKIEKRAVVVDDQIVVRPMMYVALSYDHRLIDGEQAVTFLVRVKERIEDPARLLLGV